MDLSSASKPAPARWRRHAAAPAATLAAAAVYAAALAPVGCFALKVQLRANGSPWDVPSQTLDASSFEDLMHRVSTSGMPGLGGGAKGFWLADDDGRRLESWEQVLQLPEDRRAFFAVPEGRLFQWSPRKPGERWKVDMEGRTPVEIETVARSPGVFLLHNMFSEEESQFLIKRAAERTGENALKVSGVGFKTMGERDKLATRTSANAFDSESPEALSLMRRCFEALRIPFKFEMADGLQILRYEKGQAYINHTDWFSVDADGYEHNFDSSTPEGSNRYATVFLYLVTPSDGGYTVFPKATADAGTKSSEFISMGEDSSVLQREVERAKSFFGGEDTWEVELTRMCYSSMAVRPVKLGAALFYHQDAMTGRLLPQAEHGACPSFGDTKWGANLWIWNRDRHLTKPPPAEQVTAGFRNTGDVALKLEFSMDEGKSWSPFTALAPGQSFGANTYHGHHWRFVTDEDKPAVVKNIKIVPGESKPIFASHDAEL